MAGLLDLFGGGGGGKDDDSYADILTPGQRNQMLTQGLLAMAGAFADAGMPSRLPIPFGAALGKAAAALGTGQEAGMKAAIENALAAQKVRDLRNLSQFRTQFFGDQGSLNDRVRDLITPGAAPAVRPAASAPAPAGTYVGPRAPSAAPAADGPLMIDQPYPAGGGLLGPDIGAAGEYGGGQKTAGAGSGGGLLGEGFGGGSSAADLGAGGDDATPARGPTSAPPWAADPLNRGLRGDTTGQSAMDRFRSEVFGGGGAEDLYSSLTPRSAGGATARGETPEITRLIEQAAAQQGVSPDVLRGLIKTESNFRPNAVSPQGAVGVAQLMPATARGLGVTDPTDPAQAIPAGARYLREGLDASGGDLTKALMYYHGGPNQAMWGPRTQAYPGAVLAAAGRTTEGSGGSAEPDPYASLTPTPGGQPPAAPGSMPQMAPPGASQIPQIQAPPGADPAKFNALLLELARRNAAAEVLGMGNPYGSMLSVLQGSPQYKAAIEAATRGAGLPFVEPEAEAKARGGQMVDLQARAYQASLDRVTAQLKIEGEAANTIQEGGILVSDGKGGTQKIQATRKQAIMAANGLAVPELGIPGLVKPSGGGGDAGQGGSPAAGTPAGKPELSPGQTKSQETGVAAGWKALEDTHAGELAANRRDQQLGQLAEAMQGFTPGATADLRVKGQAILRDLGLIKGDEVPSAETFQRAARQLQLTAAPKGQGSVSNYERELYGEAVVSLANTPEGVAKAIDIARRLDQYDRNVAQIHRDVAKQNGGTPNLIEAQQRIAGLGPPLSAGEINSLEQIRAGKVPGPGQASGSGAGIDKAAYDRLPSGAPYIAPDGSQRIKP